MSKKNKIAFELHLYSKEQNKAFVNGIEYPISNKTKDDFFKLQNMDIKSRKVFHDNLIKTFRKNEFKQELPQIKKYCRITFNHSNERMNQYSSIKQGYYSDHEIILKVIKDFKEKNQGLKCIMYSNYDEIPNEYRKEASLNKYGLYEIMINNTVGYEIKVIIK